MEAAVSTVLVEESYAFESVDVNVTFIGDTRIEFTLIVSETDITVEELYELVETDLEDAIEAQDTEGQFIVITSIVVEESDSENDKNNNKGQLSEVVQIILIVVGAILGLVIILALADYFCIHKIANKSKIVLNKGFDTPGSNATPGRTETGATSTDPMTEAGPGAAAPTLVTVRSVSGDGEADIAMTERPITAGANEEGDKDDDSDSGQNEPVLPAETTRGE